jgi:hypothetical protein
VAERIYSVVFDNVAVTAAQDFFEITPADDKPCRFVGLLLSQSSDTGDAQEEILRYAIIRGHTTSGSGGTAPTPRPFDRSGPAAGFAAKVNNTTIASVGTTHSLVNDCFNVRSGLQLWFPPECWPEASQADTTIVVRLLSTPADSLTMTGTLILAEGG